MKVIIAGSRNIIAENMVLKLLDEKFAQVDIKPSLILSGTARGVDRLGELWAKKNRIEIQRCPALWTVHGRAAGFIRNGEMVERADAIICIHLGTAGSRDVLRRAEAKMPRMHYIGDLEYDKHDVDMITLHGAGCMCRVCGPIVRGLPPEHRP
jgi:hypothetical protein